MIVTIDYFFIIRYWFFDKPAIVSGTVVIVLSKVLFAKGKVVIVFVQAAIVLSEAAIA